MIAPKNDPRRVQAIHADEDNVAVDMPNMSAVSRIIKDIVNEDPHQSFTSVEGMARNAAIQNLKRWSDSL